jgi:hypothetical protein
MGIGKNAIASAHHPSQNISQEATIRFVGLL